MVQLDVLRGFAILLVLFTHSPVQSKDAGAWRPALAYLQFLGPTGVDLFFVLSGFLVGGLLLRELRDSSRLDVRRFLIRRGFKIWPSYFVYVAAVFVGLIVILHQSAGDAFRALVPNLLHLQNYLGSPKEHTWSLAVEEHFYLVLPFFLWLLTARKTSALKSLAGLPAIAIGVFTTCALLRFYAYTHTTSYNPYFATHLRLDSLFFGVLLAYFYYFEPHRIEFAGRHRAKLLIAATALLGVFPAFVLNGRWIGHAVIGTFSFVMLYIAYGAFLIVMVQTPVRSGRLGRWLDGYVARAIAFIGYFSYPIYLWHMDVTKPLSGLASWGSRAGIPGELLWIGVFAVYVLVALAAGVVFGVLLDKPSLALRDRLFPARTRSPIPPPPAGAELVAKADRAPEVI